ncbi:PTS sugar transporter subunit IIC [Xylocopilactobacillus apicola]|uniref:Permease IIC component n=1 Tax=Xylocopilactobacillus apicola TaxID=2932184 RepID=A0AAU9DR19_9LACO|nr:PTS transporter subunit EIIC [Xylocopilactobacillus apicola]BDR57593.1 permease IIC component [Xylocopilactobacillus apicola]
MKSGEKLNNLIVKFSNNIFIKAIADGMMAIMPITLLGSFLLVIKMIPNLPKIIINICTIGANVSSNLIALFIAIALSYTLAREMKSNIIASIILALACFTALMPNDALKVEGKPVPVIKLDYMGSKGIIVAMICSLLVTWSFAKLIEKKVTIRMPESVPPFINKTFESIVPAAIVFSVTIIIAALMQLTKYHDIQDFIYKMLQAPLQNLGNSVWSMLLIMLLSEMLWWFGIHGSNVTQSIIMVLFASNGYANMASAAAGKQPTNIISSFFIDAYKGPRALAIVFVILLFCKSEKLKAIGKVSFIPSWFGITEPMKFGIPQVMNPLMFIPLTLAAPICMAIAYVATKIGFIPIIAYDVPKQFPAIFGGFVAGGWQGFVVQIIQFVVVVALYLPFLKKQDKIELANELANLEAQEA